MPKILKLVAYGGFKLEIDTRILTRDEYENLLAGKTIKLGDTDFSLVNEYAEDE